MRLGNERESDNVDDRRGQGGFDGSSNGGFGGFGGGFGGGLGSGRRGVPLRGGLGTLIVIGVVLWFLGVSPTQIIGLLLGGGFETSTGTRTTQTQTTGASGYGQKSGQTTASNDEMTHFVRQVLATTEDAWGEMFAKVGRQYQSPTLVIYSGSTRAAGCGFAQTATGPFYCPDDQKVYIDLAFYDELKRRFASPGDFAEAYVIAHEIGHHVQNLLGILPKYHQARQSMSEKQADALSVRIELQADCLAGVWGRSVADKGILEPGDLDEALNAATHIGDDAIQKQAQGYAVPDTFTHGSGAQRKAWFMIGYDSGSLQSCDTLKRTTP